MGGGGVLLCCFVLFCFFFFLFVCFFSRFLPFSVAATLTIFTLIINGIYLQGSNFTRVTDLSEVKLPPRNKIKEFKRRSQGLSSRLQFP